jgi:hypothetical protein
MRASTAVCLAGIILYLSAMTFADGGPMGWTAAMVGAAMFCGSGMYRTFKREQDERLRVQRIVERYEREQPE